jgi:hypothetical protein
LTPGPREAALGHLGAAIDSTAEVGTTVGVTLSALSSRP